MSKMPDPSTAHATPPYSKENTQVYGSQNILPYILVESILPEFDQYLVLCIFFSFLIATLSSKALGLGTSGSAVRISVCLTSLTRLHSITDGVILPPIQNTVRLHKQITLCILYCVSQF
jgi:hypothetical protein